MRLAQLLLLALCSQLSSQFAYAEVSVYGSLRAGVVQVSGIKTDFRQRTEVNDFGSRIGFRGNEALGQIGQAQVDTIWQIEQGFSIDGQQRGRRPLFANRESFVGLSHPALALRLGNLLDVLGETTVTDVWIDAALAGQVKPLYTGIRLRYRGREYYNFEDGTINNAIKLNSNYADGLNYSFIYAFHEQMNRSGMPKKPANLLGARVSYQHNDFNTALAYQEKSRFRGTEKTARVYRFELGKTVQRLTLLGTLQYAKLYDQIFADDTLIYPSRDIVLRDYAISTLYQLDDKVVLKGSVSRRRASNTPYHADSLSAEQYSLGLDYHWTKRTRLFSQYGCVKHSYAVNDLGQRREHAMGIGIRHNF